MFSFPAGRSRRRMFFGFVVAALCLNTAVAQSASTVPIGATRVRITAGTIIAPVVTSFALPFENLLVGPGSKVGRVRAVAGDTIAISGASWLPGQLAEALAPYALRFISGGAAGRVFLVAGNTADGVKLQAADMASLVIAAGPGGDLVEVFPVETLDTLFGPGQLIGGSDPSAADIVYVGSTMLDGYYFHTGHNQWRKANGRMSGDRANVALLPHSVIHVARVGPATAVTLVGRVPATPFYTQVARSGNTYTHSGFPTDVTLTALALERRIADWIPSATPHIADQVSFPVDGRWKAVYYNGANWIDPASGSVQDSAVIRAGTPLLIDRPGAAAGSSVLVRQRPYSL